MAALVGCKDGTREAPAPAPIPDVRVTDAQGTLVAELKQTRPCRATIGPQELIVGGPPLISTVGSASWAGQDEPNGTILTRNGERIARIYPVGDAASAAVFDMHGIAQVRINTAGALANVENSAAVPIRTLKRAGDTITTSEPAYTITGTQDLVLAALLSAPELLPEVRMLAACERVLVKKGP